MVVSATVYRQVRSDYAFTATPTTIVIPALARLLALSHFSLLVGARVTGFFAFTTPQETASTTLIVALTGGVFI